MKSKKNIQLKKGPEQESAESNKEAATNYEQEKEELRMWLAVYPDEDETVDPEILFVKYLIVDWESQNLGSVNMEDIHVYKIIRADGNTSYHKTFSSMLKKFDRQDLMDLHRLVMKRFEDNTPEGYNLLLWGDLKILLVMVSDAGEDYMRMEQYLTHIEYALWEVIMNDDAPAIVSSSTEGPIPPKTAEQKLAKKNELKAKSTLLLVIPDEHLLKFHGINDAKTLWEAIKARFGGNKESKKMQKTILKQQYENFTASRSEGLDKTYDRFQKLISQLEIHGEVISQEDANLKLLRSLASAWNNIALIMRNKADLDELSMDE
ncbi:hypothetical protein Tco_1208800 [Tanacetum coccineum]